MGKGEGRRIGPKPPPVTARGTGNETARGGGRKKSALRGIFLLLLHEMREGTQGRRELYCELGRRGQRPKNKVC